MSAEPLRELLGRLTALHEVAADDGQWQADSDHDVVSSNGQVIASCFYDRDAALIVAAVNALPELVARLRAVADVEEELQGTAEVTGGKVNGYVFAGKLRAVLCGERR